VPIGKFHVDQFRTRPVGRGLCGSGAARAECGVEKPSRTRRRRIEPARRSGGQDDGLGAYDPENRCGFLDAEPQSPDDLPAACEYVRDGQVILNFHAALPGLPGQHGLLVVAGVLQPDPRSTWKGVSHELPFAVGSHGDSPGIPVPDPGKGLFEKLHRMGAVMKPPDQAVPCLLKDRAHVVTVHLRDITEKVVIARSSGPAPLGVGLFGHRHRHPLIRRVDGGHQPGDSAPHDQHVRLYDFLINIDHCCYPFSLRFLK